jgi:hypothetical protein
MPARIGIVVTAVGLFAEVALQASHPCVDVHPFAPLDTISVNSGFSKSWVPGSIGALGVPDTAVDALPVPTALIALNLT